MMQKRQQILEVIFPKARANILRLLFMKPKKPRYVRELARLGDVALSTTQEELDNLLTVGLITATTYSDGCKRFYRANRDHPLFPHLLGIVHGSGRMREVDVSKLRRIRRPKWKRKNRPEPVYWRPPARPTGRMFSPPRITG